MCRGHTDKCFTRDETLLEFPSWSVISVLKEEFGPFERVKPTPPIPLTMEFLK